MKLTVSNPLTVIYRGTIEDTAVLVGLAQARANVGVIAFTAELSHENKNYCDLVNQWLFRRNMPSISIHPILTGQELERVLHCPLENWHWGKAECIAAIKLAGLPLPSYRRVV